MAINRRRFGVPPAAVWATLSDGYSYGHWVVGTRKIRAVDQGFPAKGTRLHYTVGYGPARHDGHTEVLEVDQGRRLVLEAHAWPVGSARIELVIDDLEANDGACLVTINERPSKGLPARLHNPVQDLFLRLRNVETLRRLEQEAHRHADRD